MNGDRQSLLGLVAALKARDNLLRRDECGDWRITGQHGHIYAAAIEGVEGFQIYFRGAREFEVATPQAWTWAKKAMKPFARVTQDGDEEGFLFLDRLPTPGEAEVIRDKLKIAKKRELSPEELDRLRRQGFRSGDDGSDLGSPADT